MCRRRMSQLTDKEKEIYIILYGWIPMYEGRNPIQNWRPPNDYVPYALENAYLHQINSPDLEYELSLNADKH
jgi:hypothetical protein